MCMPWSGLDSVFFATTGAEAVENSIKLARHATGKQNVIVFQGTFLVVSINYVSVTFTVSINYVSLPEQTQHVMYMCRLQGATMAAVLEPCRSQRPKPCTDLDLDHLCQVMLL